MARVALMRVAAIAPVRRFLRRIGVPVDRILERLRVPVDLFRHSETLIPAYLGSRFIAEGARAVGSETLGAKIGEATVLEDLGSFGRQMRQSATLYDAVLNAQRLGESFHSGEKFWLTSLGAASMFCRRFTVPLDDWFQQSDQYALLTALRLFRSVAGPTWRPIVHLRNGIPTAIRDIDLLRDAEIVFDQPACGIVTPPALLHLPLSVLPGDSPATDVDVAGWRGSGPARDLVTSLRQWMMGVIGTDAVRIDVMAGTIGATPRTLQRRLAEVGTTYARLLAQSRFDVTARLLARDDLAIRDIAHEVGYHDAAHLTRAFQRWSGTTPGRFRRLQRGVITEGGFQRTAPTL